VHFSDKVPVGTDKEALYTNKRQKKNKKQNNLAESFADSEKNRYLCSRISDEMRFRPRSASSKNQNSYIIESSTYYCILICTRKKN
jgi:hypothetical protein